MKVLLGARVARAQVMLPAALEPPQLGWSATGNEQPDLGAHACGQTGAQQGAECRDVLVGVYDHEGRAGVGNCSGDQLLGLAAPPWDRARRSTAR